MALILFFGFPFSIKKKNYVGARISGLAPYSVYHDCGDSGCLFDIFLNPTEHDNINETHPVIQKEMLAKLQAYQATYFSPDRGVQDPKACDVAFNVNGGFWGPFLD